jgi:hypothetical protein
MTETLSIICAVSDVLILAWLVGTWFYEGHHKKCEVTVTCDHCGNTAEHRCESDPRNK